jgi:hypothetical protein
MKTVKSGETIIIYPNQGGYNGETELRICAEARNTPVQIILSPNH